MAAMDTLRSTFTSQREYPSTHRVYKATSTSCSGDLIDVGSLDDIDSCRIQLFAAITGPSCGYSKFLEPVD